MTREHLKKKRQMMGFVLWGQLGVKQPDIRLLLHSPLLLLKKESELNVQVC